MSAMVKRNMLFLMMVGGLVGCGTMSGEGHHTGASGGEAARTAQPGQSAPDNVVKTGMSQEDTTAGGTSQEQNTSSAAANQAEQRSGAQPSDRGRAVQVSCPEPTNAQAGQCFTRVLYPPRFNEQQVEEVVRPAYEKITYTEPVYEDVQEQVLVREAYTREIEVPALYDTYYEQILEKPAGKIWKKGRGAVERVDPQTGEVYCLIDQPALYRTVERKELKRPAGTRTEVVPAEYTTRTVHKLVTPPQEVRTTVPAETAAVTKKALVSGDSCEYVQVLCQDNATTSKIHEVERALQDRGYQVDNDGLDDEDLAAALRQFQEKNQLPQTGLMTARTLDALGIALETAQQPETATGGARQ